MYKKRRWNSLAGRMTRGNRYKGGRRAAVFLDRDGTINEDRGYIGDPAEVVLIEGAAGAIARLNRRGIPVIVLSNQSGIGRGFYDEGRLDAVNRRLGELLGSGGASVDGIYCCPHHPGDNCGCGKPETGLLMDAAREHGIDLPRSVMVGDKVSDMELARRVGMRRVLVLTGYGEISLVEIRQGSGGSEGLRGPGGDGRGLSDVDFVAADLADAVEWILSEDGPLSGPHGAAEGENQEALRED